MASAAGYRCIVRCSTSSCTISGAAEVDALGGEARRAVVVSVIDVLDS